MPTQDLKPGGAGGQKEDIGAAIRFATQNSGALITAVRVLVGFFSALFARKKVMGLLDAGCPFCGR